MRSIELWKSSPVGRALYSIISGCKVSTCIDYLILQAAMSSMANRIHREHEVTIITYMAFKKSSFIAFNRPAPSGIPLFLPRWPGLLLGVFFGSQGSLLVDSRVYSQHNRSGLVVVLLIEPEMTADPFKSS